MEPQKIPNIISTPRLPSIDRATGSMMDMPITEDSPGITPTKMPPSTPPRMATRPIGVTTRDKPERIALIFAPPYCKSIPLGRTTFIIRANRT